jgi:transaldolase/glucose-6-phosphate isomerase
VATSVGFGPRYLHSTGQAHKGGPASGLFLVVTDEPRPDLPVPGQRLSFGQAIAAQARGDAAVLAARGRRLLRVHLGGPAEELLPRLAGEIERALAESDVG